MRNRAEGEGECGDFLGNLVEEEVMGQWWAGHQLRELGV